MDTFCIHFLNRGLQEVETKAELDKVFKERDSCRLEKRSLEEEKNHLGKTNGELYKGIVNPENTHCINEKAHHIVVVSIVKHF